MMESGDGDQQRGGENEHLLTTAKLEWKPGERKRKEIYIHNRYWWKTMISLLNLSVIIKCY